MRNCRGSYSLAGGLPAGAKPGIHSLLSQYIHLCVLVFISKKELLILPFPVRVSVVGTVPPLSALWAKGVVGEDEGTDSLGRASSTSVPRQGEFAPAALICNAWKKASFGSGTKYCRCW